MLLWDVFNPYQSELLINELKQIGIRLDEKPPNVTVDKKNSGGLQITNLVENPLSDDLIRSILRINGIHHARVLISEPISTDQLIDVAMQLKNMQTFC